LLSHYFCIFWLLKWVAGIRRHSAGIWFGRLEFGHFEAVSCFCSHHAK